MRAVFASLALAFLSTLAHAEGLVQLTLTGSVTAVGGAPIQIEIASVDPAAQDRLRTTSLDLLLAQGTTAADLGALLARRLEQAGIGFVRAEAAANGPGRASLFVEHATAVALRLGNGLGASITLCDTVPTSARLSPGREAKAPCQVSVVAHTQNPVTFERRHLDIAFTLEATATLNEANSKLALSAISAGWRSELKSNEWWLPKPAAEHGNVTGCVIEAATTGDWRVDVTL